MAVPVAAILKKVAVAVGSNKNVLKTVCGIVLGIIFIVLMPIIALLGLFSGDAELDIDTEPIYGWIEEGQTEFTETFDEIEEKMAEAGFSEERIGEARILYEYSLFRFSTEEKLYGQIRRVLCRRTDGRGIDRRGQCGIRYGNIARRVSRRHGGD